MTNASPRSTWHKGPAEWTIGQRAFLSVAFTWDLDRAYQRAAWYYSLGYEVFAGGPTVALRPDYLAPVATTHQSPTSALPHHNPQATFTSRGCIRRCKFCAVPKIEGALVELQDWEPKPIVCDNNLLATSRKHFDRVVDRLKPIKGVDFNQGLDARLLTDHRAWRLAELDIHKVRLAWDHTRDEQPILDAIMRLRRAGITKRAIGVYVLVGFDDTPADALCRCETLKRKWGIDPRPMRYQPLDTMKKNSYVRSYCLPRGGLRTSRTAYLLGLDSNLVHRM